MTETKMKYAYLGESGLKVSRIVLGCMSYGSKKWGDWVLEEEESLKLMKYAYDHGIRTFDTADTYSHGESEILVGKFLKKYNIPRSTIVIASKVYNITSADGLPIETHDDIQNRGGLSRKHILDAVEGSVERLGTYIDLYQIHRYDPRTPDLEIMQALHDCVQSGKVRYIGASSMRAFEFAGLQHVADKHNLTKFISMQNYYNLQYREEEREMIPYCNKTGVGLLPWSPNNFGLLARPVNGAESTARSGSESFNNFTKPYQNEHSNEIRNRVEQLAKKKNVSMAQIAVAWDLHKGTHPIVGLNSEKRIYEAIGALAVELSSEDLELLEEPYKPMAVQGITQTPQFKKYYADA